MFLIYSQENESATPEDRSAVFAGHLAVMEETRQRGIFHAADPLEGPATATTVRVQNADVLITDGPFAETKEQLAGFYILNCKDLDAAIEMAARVPDALSGSVEIRPVLEIM